MIYYDNFLYIACIIWTIIMIVFAERKEFRFSKYFRLLYLFPFFLLVFLGEIAGINKHMVLVYVSIFIITACFFLQNNFKRIRTYLCIAALVLICVNLVYNLRNPNFRPMGYVEDFKYIYNEMKEYYALTEHKNIDWDELYNEYLPMFQEADNKNDEYLMYSAWRHFAYSFNDAHVYMFAKKNDAKLEEKYANEMCGYDYGFELVTLSDGRTVFAEVDEESKAYEAGVRNGLTIVSFDNVPVDRLKEDSYIYFYEFPDKDNEAFLASLFVTAKGKEESLLTFYDENNELKTITVYGQGSNYERMKTTSKKLLGGEYGNDVNNNLSYRMLDDKTACLIINEMDIESEVRYGNAESHEYSGLARMIAGQIEAIKAQGADNLIIDMRGNHGGYLEVSAKIASYFTDRELFGAKEGERTDTPGVYKSIAQINVEPGNIWGDGKIIILVNAQTVSAAELFIYMLNQLDNVTVMGFTNTSGSSMGVISTETKSVEVYYPDMIMLDENDEILIDAGEDRIIRMKNDIIIPFDETAFNSIFINGEDYALDYALKYIEE